MKSKEYFNLLQDIIILCTSNKDYTINYVGTIGHIAFGSNIKRIGDESLLRIDYAEFSTSKV